MRFDGLVNRSGTGQTLLFAALHGVLLLVMSLCIANEGFAAKLQNVPGEKKLSCTCFVFDGSQKLGYREISYKCEGTGAENCRCSDLNGDFDGAPGGLYLIDCFDTPTLAGLHDAEIDLFSGLIGVLP